MGPEDLKRMQAQQQMKSQRLQSKVLSGQQDIVIPELPEAESEESDGAGVTPSDKERKEPHSKIVLHRHHTHHETEHVNKVTLHYMDQTQMSEEEKKSLDRDP